MCDVEPVLEGRNDQTSVAEGGLASVDEIIADLSQRCPNKVPPLLGGSRIPDRVVRDTLRSRGDFKELVVLIKVADASLRSLLRPVTQRRVTLKYGPQQQVGGFGRISVSQKSES